MTERVVAGTARKRIAGKRKTRPKGRHRRPGILLIAALAALVAGFLARRMMLPSAVRYLGHRAPDRPGQSEPGSGSMRAGGGRNEGGESRDRSGPRDEGGNPAAEHLTDRDRQQLNSIINHKAK